SRLNSYDIGTAHFCARFFIPESPFFYHYMIVKVFQWAMVLIKRNEIQVDAITDSYKSLREQIRNRDQIHNMHNAQHSFTLG
ncbi:hypothetical protein ACJX0J_028818, partial [Zea mays]